MRSAPYYFAADLPFPPVVARSRKARLFADAAVLVGDALCLRDHRNVDLLRFRAVARQAKDRAILKAGIAAQSVRYDVVKMLFVSDLDAATLAAGQYPLAQAFRPFVGFPHCLL